MIFIVGELLDNELSSLFFQLQSLIFIVTAISRFGSEDYLLRISSSHDIKSNFKLILNQNFILQNILTAILLFFSISFFFELVLSEILLAVLFGLTYNYGLYYSVLFQGYKEYNRSSFAIHISHPLYVIFSVLLIQKISLNIIYLSLIAGVLTGIYLSRLNFANNKNKINYSLPKLFKYKSLGFSTIGGEILRNAPILLSIVYLTSEETVTWTYSIKIVQLCSVFVMLLNFYFSPKIRKSFLSNGIKGVEKILINPGFKNDIIET